MKKIIIIIGLFILSAVSVHAYTFTETIRYGKTNSSDVYQLQEKLINEGYLAGTPNGSVYNTTLNAIKKFQKKHGLVGDGVIGPKTRAVLNKISAKTKIKTTTVALNGMPYNLKKLAEKLWQPLCNGEGSTECIDPIIGFSQLPREAQWLIWAEEGTFDGSVPKTLDVRIANCLSSEACSVSFTYEETHVCRYQSTYTSEPCL